VKSKPDAKQLKELEKTFKQYKEEMKLWKKMSTAVLQEDETNQRDLKEAMRAVEKYAFIVELPTKAVRQHDLLEIRKKHGTKLDGGDYLVHCILTDRAKAWHPVLG
jgi:hypothetical protein